MAGLHVNAATLTDAVFTRLETAVAPVIESPALVHRVPHGQLYRVGVPRGGAAQNRPFRLRLVTRADFSFTATGTTHTLALPANRRMAQSPDLPGSRSVAVGVQAGAGSFTRWADANVTFNPAAQTVQLAGLVNATAYNVSVYGLIGDAYGRVRVVVARAGGGGRTGATQVDSRAVVMLHEQSQTRPETIPEIAAVALALPSDEIQVTLHSTVPHIPPAVLNPGGLRLGWELETLELRVNIVHLAGMLAWARQSGAPELTAAELLAALRAVQAGDLAAATRGPLARLPQVPGLAVE